MSLYTEPSFWTPRTVAALATLAATAGVAGFALAQTSSSSSSLYSAPVVTRPTATSATWAPVNRQPSARQAAHGWAAPMAAGPAEFAMDGEVPMVAEYTPAQPQGPGVMPWLLVPLAVISAVISWYRYQTTGAQPAMMSYAGRKYGSPLTPATSRGERMVLYGKTKNDNFIDQTFTVIADQLLKFLPTTSREKKAFAYYRDGMSAQGTGEYAEALQNYYEALKLETDPYDRSFILYNIGLIHGNNGEINKALEYYYQALERNANLPSALNNIAVIYHFQGETAEVDGRIEDAFELYDKAADYWKEAIRLAPDNYLEAQNWLQSRGDMKGSAMSQPY